MVNTIDLESQGQIKGGLTKPDILKKYGNSAWRVMTILGLLVSSSCSVTEAQNNISKPAETAPIPGANEPQLAMQPFEINKEYPEALQPYVDVFKNMATKDKLDLNLINNFDFILARDAVKGTTVEYALMPMAVVNGLTDPDGELANQKPVYYLAYKDEQGQVKGNYVLGRLLEQDSEGNVSYVSRILSDASFQDWLNNTQSADSQIDLGQIVYATALANGIDIKQARKIEQQLTGGELSSADFMKQYALGVSFIQPGQAARQVTIVNPLMPDNTPVEPSIAPSFWSRLFGVQPVLAAGLELEATATAPGITPTAEPTPTIEPTPMAEPTLSAEQQQQSIMDQFVSGPFYDQYIADNQIPEQAATAFYNQYPGVDGEFFAIVTMKVDPNSLSEEQKALNIPQRDYLVVKTADGQIEFKLLPANLQLETFSKSAVEFTLSKEYQKGVQDYLNAMELAPDAITMRQVQKEINGQQIDFIEAEPNQEKLTELQKKYIEVYGKTPLFIKAPNDKGEMVWIEATRALIESNGLNIGMAGSINQLHWSPEKTKMLEIINRYLGGSFKLDYELMWELPDFPEDSLRPSKNEFNFINLNRLIEYYNNYGIQLAGQTLLVQHPYFLSDWTELITNKEELKEVATTHIQTLVSKYPQISRWTVMSELENPYFRNHWTSVMKLDKNNPDTTWIVDLYKAAKNSNQNATLIYSDFDIEFGGNKANRVFSIIEQAIKQGAPIDAIAFQMHLSGHELINPNIRAEKMKQLAIQIQNYQAIGVKVEIGEMDIAMHLVPEDQKDIVQASIINDIMRIALANNVSSIYYFGFNDQLNWRNSTENGGGQGAVATPFNSFNKPKASYYSMLQAIYTKP